MTERPPQEPSGLRASQVSVTHSLSKLYGIHQRMSMLTYKKRMEARVKRNLKIHFTPEYDIIIIFLLVIIPIKEYNCIQIGGF